MEAQVVPVPRDPRRTRHRRDALLDYGAVKVTS